MNLFSRLRNNHENLETIGEAGFWYDGQQGAGSLTPVLDDLLRNPEKLAEFRQRARHRAETVFDWEAVTGEYERLFYQVLSRPQPERLNQ